MAAPNMNGCLHLTDVHQNSPASFVKFIRYISDKMVKRICVQLFHNELRLVEYCHCLQDVPQKKIAEFRGCRRIKKSFIILFIFGETSDRPR